MLENITKKEELPSISHAIEWLVREKRIGDRLDVLIKAIEAEKRHVMDTTEVSRGLPGGVALRTRIGICQLGFCNKKGELMEGKYREWDR